MEGAIIELRDGRSCDDHKTIKWDGRQLTKPGILFQASRWRPITPQRYLRRPQHIVIRLAQDFSNESPAHFYQTWHGNQRGPNRPKAERSCRSRSAPFGAGRKFFAKAVHHRAEEWPDEHGVIKPWNNNRTVCKTCTPNSENLAAPC